MLRDDLVWALGARGVAAKGLCLGNNNVDARDKPGHDEFVERLLAKEAANS